MLKDVPVNAIWVDKMGCFHGKLHKFECEYILSHIVRMSQQRGEWITEFSVEEYLKDFNSKPLKGGFPNYLNMLSNLGYLNLKASKRKIQITQKFEMLCAECANI